MADEIVRLDEEAAIEKRKKKKRKREQKQEKGKRKY